MNRNSEWNRTYKWVGATVSFVVFLIYFINIVKTLQRFYVDDASTYRAPSFNGRLDDVVVQHMNSALNDTTILESLDYGVNARAFQWNGPMPCFKPDPAMKTLYGYRSPAESGILFMKLQKTGGSTAAGITMRIARNTAIRKREKFWICRGRWDHGWAHHLLYNRNRSQSFTWTVLREPTQRIVSAFFHFEVSRKNRSDSDESFVKFLRRQTTSAGNYYLQTLSLQKVTVILDSKAPMLINQIVADYDFIGITERMDESAVALAMVANLPLGDFLYLNAKGKGGYDDGAHLDKCFYIRPSHVSPVVQQYFQSHEWAEQTAKWDTLLYRAANRSLDLTIDRLGRAAFEEQLSVFRRAQQLARDRCLLEEVFPCTSTGVKNRNASCLWSDSGCGYRCLDEIATELAIV